MEIENKHPPKGKIQCQLFTGRLQPIHLGHLKIIESMRNPVVAIVKGSKSSEDKTRNPFSVDYQIELLKKAAPHAKIITVTSGFLPAIINQLRRESLEPTAIYAGEDRIAGYQSQIDGANKRLPDDAKIHVVFKQAERVTSATTVRNAIKNDDQKAFRYTMPESLWGEFEKMKKIMSEEIDTLNVFEPFSTFIVEEGEPTTTTGNVEFKDRMLFKKKEKIAKRKSLTTTKESLQMKSFQEFIDEATLDEATYTSNHTGSIESVAKLHANAQALGGHKVIHSEVKPDGSHMMITKKGSQVRVHHITAGKSGTTKVTTITNRPATPEESKKHFAPL